MQSKWTYAVFTLTLLTGCVSQPPYIPKTDEQTKQESLDETIVSMKERGATQDQIDSLIAHSKLSFEDQLKSRISTISTPGENLVDLVDGGLFYCDLKRSSLKTPISYEYTRKLQNELVECVSTSSRVITNYYYDDYISSSGSDAVKATVDETYLKWNSYLDSIFNSSPSYLQDQASLGVKDQINRTRLVFVREAQKKQ